LYSGKANYALNIYIFIRHKRQNTQN